MSNNYELSRVLNSVVRLMRVNGLALVCFHRLGYTDFEGYKNHLKESLGLLEYLPGDEADKIAAIFAEHAQAPDSDFANVSRRIERAFVENSRIRELETREREYLIEINDLKRKLELLEVQVSPVKSILRMLARRLKYREFERDLFRSRLESDSGQSTKR